MTTQQSNVSNEAIEQLLQQKLREFSVAEEAGKDRDELNAIYKEIKNLQYQLTLGNTAASVNR